MLVTLIHVCIPPQLLIRLRDSSYALEKQYQKRKRENPSALIASFKVHTLIAIGQFPYAKLKLYLYVHGCEVCAKLTEYQQVSSYINISPGIPASAAESAI